MKTPIVHLLACLLFTTSFSAAAAKGAPLAAVAVETPILMEGIYTNVWLGVTGGVAPYTLAIEGEIPNGMWYNDESPNEDLIDVRGTPDDDTAGTYTFTVQVTDDEGETIEREFTLVVADNPNRKPIIDSWTPEKFSMRLEPGVMQTFEVEASDPDGDTLTYQWFVNVYDQDGDWLDQLNAGTGSSYGFSRATETNERYHVWCQVSDGTWYVDHGWDVRVAETRPLAAVAVETPILMEGIYTNVWLGVTGGVEPYTLTIEGDIPDGMWYDGSEGARQEESWLAIYGPPDDDTAGTYTFTVQVTDDEGETVEREFTLVVADNPNRKPTFVSATPAQDRIRVEPGNTISLSVEATDPDGDDLTYTWEVYKNGEWSSDLYRYDVSGATYELPTSVGDADTYEFVVYASDGTWGPWMKSWTVRVAPFVPLSVTEVETPTLVEDVHTNVWLGITGGVEPYTLTIDGVLPNGMWHNDIISEETQLSLNGSPYEGTSGTYTFSVCVTDDSGETVEREFTLVVVENPNQKPVIESSSPDSGNVVMHVGESETFSVVATDPDGDELQYSWYISVYDPEYEWWKSHSDGTNTTFTFSPSETEAGVYHILCFISDEIRSIRADWYVTVVPVRAIIIDPVLPHATNDIPYSAQLVATEGTEPYSWATLYDYYTVGISESGLLTIDTDDWDIDNFDTYPLSVIVSDSTGNCSTQTVVVVFDENPNKRPVIDEYSPGEDWDGFAHIGEARTFSVTAHDPEGEPLTFEWTLDDEILEETGPTWAWTPERADIGAHLLEVRCTDGQRRSWTTNWRFTVVTTNVLSAVVELPTAGCGEPYSASFSVSGGTEPYVWSIPKYDMSRETNSFSEVGVAQDWATDDDCLRIALPFRFPFYGQTYDKIWISDNGTICFDGTFSQFVFETNDFTAHALIAPLWTDMDGKLQTVYIDESISGQIKILWNAHYWEDDDGPIVAFAVTLSADGAIRISYGDEAQAGAVGISAGDGVRFLLPEALQGADLGGAEDVVFRPASFAPGVSLAPTGTVSGRPTTAGTYRVPVAVSDAEGATWSGEAVLYVMADASGVTLTTPVPVPYSFLDTDYPTLLAAHGGNYEAAANATAANGVNKVWECYVAGLVPTNATERFLATITIDANGEPIISWVPDLNENGTKEARIYTIEGKDELTNDWGPTNECSRFFRVKVELRE